MSFLVRPHLPERPITSAIASSALPDDMRDALSRRGIRLYTNPKNPALSQPICTHPDLSMFYFGAGRILVDRSAAITLPPDMRIVRGTAALGEQYPLDIAYDACQIGRYLLCRPDATAPEILREPLTVVPIRQGYAKCSIAIVNERAAITEDAGIANAMRLAGLDVLEISPGAVLLPGYNRGFIGGACGKIAPDLLAFFGDITRHPQYESICRFCRKYGVEPLSLSTGDHLTDYGSLIPLTE